MTGNQENVSEDRYEHIELIVKSRTDSTSWFDVIHDFITKDCDSVRHCGMEHMGGMSGTLKQCYDHSTALGHGLQPIDVARAIVHLTERNYNTLGTHEQQVAAEIVIKALKWARKEIEFEDQWNNPTDEEN